MKTCNKCGSTKPSTEFHRDKAASDGFTGRCKECRNRLWRKNSKTYKSRRNDDDSIRRVFLWPDTHTPWHNKLSVKCALNALKAFKPDDLVIMGDFGDFYAVSRYAKNPGGVRFIDEIRAIKGLLEEVKSAAGDAKCYFLAGNHEERLIKYLKDKAPEIFELVPLPDLLGLNELGFEYIPYRQHVMLGKLVVTHDLGHCGMSAHKASLKKAGMSVAIGHTHQMALVIEKTLMTGDIITGTMLGWLGDEQLMFDYVPAATVKRYSVQGFGVAYLLGDGTPFICPTPIINGQCIIDGQIIGAD